MNTIKQYFLAKLKHQAFPHLAFEAIPELDAQSEDFFRALRIEMSDPNYQTEFQQKFPFEFLDEAEILELEDDEYRRYIRFFRQERIEEMMYLDDQLHGRNTLDHLLGVHYIAMKTARHLKSLGVPVDLGRVSGSASGHDIGKYGVLPEDVGRIAYFHYFYSDQWYRKRRLENIGNVAVNHSTWDLELNSLSVESLILIYSDFQVKNDSSNKMHLFSLADSFDVILNKLDNLDEHKTRRYHRVYEKLVDFEKYIHVLSSQTEPVIAFFNQSELLDEYKFEGIDESIYMMHELRSPSSIRSLLENSYDQPTVTMSLVILRLLKDYHLYLTASQKDIVLEYLYRMILHSDEVIRLQSAELLGQVLLHFDIIYRKERPASAPPNPIHRLKLRRIEQLDRFYHHRLGSLTTEKKEWLQEGYQRAKDQFLDSKSDLRLIKECRLNDRPLAELYLDNLKTAIPEDDKICNIDYLRQTDHSFRFVMHLINLVKVSSSRKVQRYAGQILLEKFDHFESSEKNDITIELLRSMDLDGNHLRIELPRIVGTILQKLPANEVLEILDDIHLSVEQSKPSAVSLLETIIQTLPSFLLLDNQTIAQKICAIFSSALVNRQHSIDQGAILRLATFYQDASIPLSVKRDFYLATGKKYLMLSREMENDFQTRLNYSNYINAVYNFVSQFENQSQWPIIADRPRIVLSANFDPMNLSHKSQVENYISQGFDVFIHLRESNWHYLLAPQQLRRVIAEMTVADLLQAYIWPAGESLDQMLDVKVIVLPEDDLQNELIRQAIQNDWQTSELLTAQAEQFIRTGYLYRNLAQQKKQARIREEFVVQESDGRLWIKTIAGRTESLRYDATGRIYEIDILSQRGLHDIGILLINQAMYRLYEQGVSFAYISAYEEISSQLLRALGYQLVDGMYQVSLSDPVVFILDLPSRLVDNYRREKRLRTVIAKNRRQIMLALHKLHPDKAIMTFDRGMFYNDLIERVKERPVTDVIIPIGSMFQHHYLPNHPTKALHIDKLYHPKTDDLSVVAQRNHLPIDQQIENLKELGETAVLIDDVLHSGRRINVLGPKLEEYHLPLSKYMVGIATNNGLNHANELGIEVEHTYVFQSISGWYLESELYLLLGGLVSINSRNDRLYSLSVNRLAPFVAQEPRREFESFSATCIAASEKFMRLADRIFREKQGRPMRLSDLNHLVFDVYIPDVFFNRVTDMTIQQFFERFYAAL